MASVTAILQKYNFDMIYSHRIIDFADDRQIILQRSILLSKHPPSPSNVLSLSSSAIVTINLLSSIRLSIVFLVYLSSCCKFSGCVGLD